MNIIKELNDIELRNGDCLEVMDKLIADGVVIDAIITDPPYKVISGGKPKHKGQPSGLLSKNDGKIFAHNDLREEDWFPKIFKLLKEGGHCYIMTNTLNLERYLRLARESGFLIHNLLVWEKNNCTPNRWYMKNCEYTLFLRKGKAKKINNVGSKTVHKFRNNFNKVHPSEKPIELMSMYIENSTNENELVLDFTMGSGTTGVACRKLGRKFIGIKLDEPYFNIAERRINEYN
jgi:site-specific DNA-methyltransferase (adenine-specific)